MDWFKSKKSSLPLAENGYNALQLLCGGQYDLLKWILQKAEIKKKNLHLLHPMLQHVDNLKDELSFGFGCRQATDSFQFLVRTLNETFHVPVGDVTQQYSENLLDLLLCFFRFRFREMEEGTSCIGQHCSALAHRIAVLLAQGLRPPAPSFWPVFLYLCFEHRYQIKETLCGIGMLRIPDYRAHPNMFSIQPEEKAQSFSSAMDILPEQGRFPNYLRWCLALTEKVTGDVSSSIVLNLAKYCKACQDPNSDDNPLDMFPEEVFAEMTNDGQSVFSMTVLTENTLFLKLLLSRSTFDAGMEVSRDHHDYEDYYLESLLGATSTSRNEGKSRKLIRRKSSEKQKPERPLSICSAGAAEYATKVFKSSRNALQEVLKKKWLPGWKLLLQQRRPQDAELYLDVLFEIIEERWFEGLKVYCEELAKCTAEGGDISKEQFLNLNHVNAQGASPLHLAIENKWPQGSQYLIRHQDVEINQPSQSGQTPLHLALDKDLVEVVVDILRHRNYDVDVNTTDGQYRMVIHKALCKGHSEIIKLLLEFKNLNLRSHDSKGNPPVHSAVLMEHTGLSPHDLQATMRHKSFDIEARDREGRTLERLMYRENIRDDLRRVIETELERRVRPSMYSQGYSTPDGGTMQMSFRKTSSGSVCNMEYPDCVRQALTQRRCELLDNMTPNRIIDVLVQESVLNPEEQEKLELMRDRDKSSYLIQKVYQNPVRHYGPFIHGLRYAGQGFLTDMLANDIQEMLIDQTNPFARGSVQHVSARYTNDRVPYRPDLSFMSPQQGRKRYTLAAHQEGMSREQLSEANGYAASTMSSNRGASRRCSCSSSTQTGEDSRASQGPWVPREPSPEPVQPQAQAEGPGEDVVGQEGENDDIDEDEVSTPSSNHYEHVL